MENEHINNILNAQNKSHRVHVNKLLNSTTIDRVQKVVLKD